MTAAPVTTKRESYALLSEGRVGNTVPQFYSVAEWEASQDHRRFEWWGVRTLTPGGPCRLNCPRDEVAATAALFRAGGHPVNISMMVDRVATVTLWAEVWDSPTGWVVYGVEYPPAGSSWRQLMPTAGRHWEGVAAKMLLKRHLNPNSYDDVEAVLERWPGHVLEFSATDRELGTIPGRNITVWEVRNY